MVHITTHIHAHTLARTYPRHIAHPGSVGVYEESLNTDMVLCITKTLLHDFDPLKHQFYIVKLGFTGVYIIFLISVKKHNLCFEQKYEKHQNLLSENFHFYWVKLSVYLNRYVFVMAYKSGWILFPSFHTRETILWLPVCLPVHLSPSKKGFSLETKKLFSSGVDSLL